MTDRMRYSVVIALLLLCLQLHLAATHPSNYDEQPAEQQRPIAAGLHAAAGDSEDDRELKNNEDGYDFFSIDQLFMNNPQYAKLLSDLQAHTFGSNWRRKRDVDDEELQQQQQEQADTTDTTASAAAASAGDDLSAAAVESSETSPTSPAVVEFTEVTKEMKETTKETKETAETVEGRTTPLKTTNPSSTTASSTFGFSGSTEASRVRTEEPTTSATPIRSSTPRRLLHKGSNKNKNKQGSNKLGAGISSSSNSNKQDSSTGSVTALNVNKFTVTNTPSASTSSGSSPSVSAGSSSSNVDSGAAAAAAVANATSVGGNNKDKVGLAPTKYHYYPHNQHIYFLPECAIQQVCNAVYVRLNYTQPLCACPPRYRDPCSASLNEDDNHTIKLVGNAQRKAITLAKTCENTNELRECRTPKDWSILALQNSRTGKSHYLVICKCPPSSRLEGPLAHDQPTYAGLPGINVYGMLCVPPESHSTKPLKSPSSPSIYNKWKVRPSISSYRDNEYRSLQNVTLATADVE